MMKSAHFIKYGSLYILLLIFIFVGIIRVRMAPAALERDEGEYAYMGQLILDGIPPYKEAANMKFPGTYVSYAVIEAVFGQTASGIRYGLLLVNIVTIATIYGYGVMLFRCRRRAEMAAVVYAIASLSYSYLGMMAHATHFVVLYGMLGLYILKLALSAESKAVIFISGFVSGLAYMAKQSGVFFIIYGAVAIWLSCLNEKSHVYEKIARIIYYLIGAFTPFAVAVYWLSSAGVLDTFVFWAFDYARYYSMPLSADPGILRGSLVEIIRGGAGWMFIAIAPCLFLFEKKIPLAEKAIWRRISYFFVISFFGVSIGFLFRHHYWIQMLPATALACALVFDRLGALAKHDTSLVGWGLCAVFCLIEVTYEFRRFFVLPPAEVIQSVYTGNPFNEAVYVARYIERSSGPSDRVFVFGSEPEVYFYSKRKSATSHIYLYPLMEEQPYAIEMQRRYMNDAEENRPKYFVDFHLNEFTKDQEDSLVLYRWKKIFLSENYHPLFMLDMYHAGDRLVAGKELADYESQSGLYVTLWQRKSN